tara:strand:+ start:84 stop:338 length:255 start_codon:yes stop_codon:yes gene_type:complete
MKKIICYYSEENNCVLLNEEPGAMSMYLTPEQAASILKRADFDESPQPGPIAQGSSAQVDELIALKKGGFTAAEIIELKQSQLL